MIKKPVNHWFGHEGNMRFPWITVWCLFPVSLNCGCASTQAQPPQLEAKQLAKIKKGSDEDLISRWKIRIVTIADVEDEKTEFDKPNGKEWEAFKANILPGDELWYFCSPGETWQELMGWRGYAIFRNGRLVTHYTTAEN